MKSGKAASERTTTLGSRDLAILRFVGNFRLTNADILYRKFFEDLKIDAMKSTLRRLIGKRPRYLFLRPQRLDGNRVIYLLTARGTVLAGVPKSFARSVRQVPLFENMAVLRFIHSEGGPPRDLLRSQKIRERFGLNGYRFTRRFFREGPENDRSLGFLIIDRLSDTRAVCRRTAEVLLRLSATPEFAKYLEKDRLTITVLAVTEDRQKELRRCIRGYLNQVLGGRPFPWPRKNGYYQWPVRVEYVPKLLSYLPGRDAPKSPSSK